jgi:hypothetical protein
MHGIWQDFGRNLVRQRFPVGAKKELFWIVVFVFGMGKNICA